MSGRAGHCAASSSNNNFSQTRSLPKERIFELCAMRGISVAPSVASLRLQAINARLPASEALTTTLEALAWDLSLHPAPLAWNPHHADRPAAPPARCGPVLCPT